MGELFQGHEGSVWSVAFSLNSSQTVSGSDDKTISASGNSGSNYSPLLFNQAGDNIKKVFTVDDNTATSHPVVHYLLHEGWVVDRHLQRLFWIPHHLHLFLRTPRTIGIMGSREMVVLDTSACRLGNSWECCIAKTNS
ncbi:hypothetical protein DL96DRAFT_1652270 [Flagelloscypha sp. PMI_526]|nr:hypothetical protein DL96DRAFT_1652270 [Flagelloscypha sp. PMI_526]